MSLGDLFNDARRRVGDVVGIAPIVRVEVGVRGAGLVRYGCGMAGLSGLACLRCWGGGCRLLGWCLGGAWVVLGWLLGWWLVKWFREV